MTSHHLNQISFYSSIWWIFAFCGGLIGAQWSSELVWSGLIHMKLQGNEHVCSCFEKALSLTLSLSLQIYKLLQKAFDCISCLSVWRRSGIAGEVVWGYNRNWTEKKNSYCISINVTEGVLNATEEMLKGEKMI